MVPVDGMKILLGRLWHCRRRTVLRGTFVFFWAVAYVFSGESNRPLTPIHAKKYRDTPPISMAYFCKSMPSLWQKVVYTPPICITIRLPFVSRYFCGSIRVRGRWDTPNFCPILTSAELTISKHKHHLRCTRIVTFVANPRTNPRSPQILWRSWEIGREDFLQSAKIATQELSQRIVFCNL